MNIDSRSKVTWEFVQSAIPDVEREWGWVDEIVREFDDLGETEMELKLSRPVDADTVVDLENAIERAQREIEVVFDEAYGRIWLTQRCLYR